MADLNLSPFSKDSFPFIVVTPSCTNNPSIAIAASRAGEWGILDLEYCKDPAPALAAIEQLVRHSKNKCGIKLDPAAGALFEIVTKNLPNLVQIIVLTASSPKTLPGQVAALRKKGVMVLLEATSLEEANFGQEIGVDGLIAKGHEAGGWVGEETTFVLLQHIRERLSLPVWAQGGIGLHTAAACYAAGAAGLVLSDQLLLTRESPLSEGSKGVVARMDGSETVCIGGAAGKALRVFQNPLSFGVEALRRTASELEQDSRSREEIVEAWRQAVAARAGWNVSAGEVCLLGQDASFASPLAKRFSTVGGVLQGLTKSIETHLAAAQRLKPLDEGAPLAKSHGTRYPIAQGPMTRVSDRAEFALRVAEGGGLPFLALALMRAPEVKTLLEETDVLLKDRPWGVGILGFVPQDLRQEQMEVIKGMRPDYALIAGGRPDQALLLEAEGIATYLHVPSPGLLRMFLEEGARRFVFEGRECGGHVGPRSSFVLWETMIETLLEQLPAGPESEECHVLFAGGIHDSISSAMVAALAAPLSARGVRIGVLMGTAYLFTEESVSSGAIQKGFQEEAIRCTQTILLESGPGHATRCADTPFTRTFLEEKRRLIAERRPTEEIHDALESLIVGRLRIASKGITRHPQYGRDEEAPKYQPVEKAEQRIQGMYMIGEVAVLRDRTSTISELHHEVSVRGTERLSSSAQKSGKVGKSAPARRPSDVAIVGMGCLLPKAPDLQAFWENILGKVDAVTEVPGHRWDIRRYFDSDPKMRDKVYSRWGGFLDEVHFDPMRYGMPPNSLKSIEPLQLLTLEVVRQALQDAGYGAPSIGLGGRPFARENASVILGVGGGIAELGQQYAVRSALPALLDGVPSQVWNALPEWTEDSFAGILLNVAAGRVANRFDLGGANYTVDAACASSLAALYLAVHELESGNSDLVIAGGAETVQNPFSYLCFSKTQALSPRGRCRTFDQGADGIAISEGLAVVVLKRLKDAERDGDRIYAVIKGVGSSSDGRDKGLTAPRPEGQIRALDRAYAKAGFSPATVGLVEAHGTGTVAGDQAEGESLMRVFASAGAAPQSCAVGSVKSMIGHTKCTAGVAGLIKIALALHHRVLPPTLHVEQPNPKVFYPENPLFVNSETRPWIASAEHPRRAGVSAFGFGGTNFHAVVEEYTGRYLEGSDPTTRRWPAELFYWVGSSRKDLESEFDRIDRALTHGAIPELHELAAGVWKRTQTRLLSAKESRFRVAVVAASLDDLMLKLSVARNAPVSGTKGVYIGEASSENAAKIAFLFPGQGSQYPDMLRDLAVHFPEVRERFESADRVLAGRFQRPLSFYVFPPPRFNPEEEKAAQKALTETHVAQSALGASAAALLWLLKSFGVSPAMSAGHSYGEYAALHAAGAFDEETLYRLSETRGRLILEAAQGGELGTMAAVQAGADEIRETVSKIEGLSIANLNSPRQTILSGSKNAIEQAIARLTDLGMAARRIPVSCAFHSSFVAPAKEAFAQYLRGISFSPLHLDVYSNATGEIHPRDPGQVAASMEDHLTQPVHFIREIEAMYEIGARIFVEVGPRNVLTNLTREILGDRPHLAVATDVPGREGRVQLLNALGQLAVAGTPVDLGRLFIDRAVRDLDTSALESTCGPKPVSPTLWALTGGAARPIGSPLPQGVPQPFVLGAVETSPVREAEPSGSVRASAPAAKGTEGNSVTQNGVNGEGEAALIGFQQLMNQFLEAQKSVMLAYLNGSSHPNAEAGRPSVEDEMPAPANATSNGADLPASAPDVETIEPVHRQSNAAPAMPAEPASVPAGEVSPEGRPDFSGLLLGIVGERTGYPKEMLGLDLNLEADLGIDSIKRVEIIGVFLRACPAPLQEQLKKNMEKLTGAKTLAAILKQVDQIIGTVKEASGEAGPASDPAGEVSPKGRPDFSGLLLGIVGERTGYPEEMLGLDLNLEADLGIDSIKRVEIIGVFLRACPSDLQERLKKSMEKLTGAKTLAAILHQVDQIVGAEPASRASQPAGPVHGREAEEVADPSYVPRFLLSQAEVPLTVSGGPSLDGQVILITDDERNIASELAGRIEQLGGAPVRVRHFKGAPARQGVLYQADLTDPEAIAALAERVRLDHGQIAGIVHLLPLHSLPFDPADHSAWSARLRLETKSLFYLVRTAALDLKRSAEKGPAWVLSASSMGGSFAGADPVSPSFFPGQGGLAGLMKTLAAEWPAVCCKAIDFEADAEPSVIASHLIAEMAPGNRQAEVGYKGPRRVILRPFEADFDRSVSAPSLDSDSVVLITGGARGITAEVAEALALRFRPKLVIVGRSPLPPENEEADTAGQTSPLEIKKRLMDRLKGRGETPKVSQVEAAFRQLMAAREIRRNLTSLKAAGARVEYHSLDVRNSDSLASLVNGIYAASGRLDGVIHGAGVIEDTFIEEKTPESLDRVFDTKAESIFLLSRLLRPESLRFLVLFASVAGRFGNRGQADYAAANEVLNKFAVYLDRRWPGRVVSVNWGPWDQAGMASASIRDQFIRRGIQVIPPAEGRRLLIEEILHGRKGEVEVVFGNGPWAADPERSLISAEQTNIKR